MKVLVNNINTETMKTSLYEFYKENSIKSNDVITIINGFQTNDDIILKENDEIIFIKKNIIPSKYEFETLMKARYSSPVFEKLKNAKVAILGLGGLGSNIAINLARTGVYNLHLIDFDIVEPTNLNRQQYKIKHLGMYKTEALKMEIKEINPYINVTEDNIKVDPSNFKNLVENDDIICEAFDNKEDKSMLVNAHFQYYPQKKLVAASGMAGYESSNNIITRKISNNFYICGDGISESKIGNSLMAPRVSICAGHESNMIIRLILGINEI